MSDQGEPTGGQLRQKLEETIEVNKQLTSQLVAERASNVIRDGGFDLVKADDLVGVAIEEIADKAKSLQEERYQQQRNLLVDVLRKNGTPDDELDSTADAMLAGQQSKPQQSAVDEGFGLLGNLPSGTPTPQVDISQLHGDDALRYGLEQAERARSKS